MARGTESRSRRPGRDNGKDGSPKPEGPSGDPGFVDTSEIEFAFTNLGEGEDAASEDGASNGHPARGEPDEDDERAADGRAAERSSGLTAGDDSQPADAASTAPPRQRRARRAGREARDTSERRLTPAAQDGRDGNGKPPSGVLPSPPASRDAAPLGRPRLKKLRLLLVFAGLGVLALVSTVFGMMMAVSQDLPAIYNFAQFRAAKNTVVFDNTGEPIGTLSSNQNKILLESGEISQNVKNATIALEDSRFYQHSGVDFQGIGRALVQDIIARSAQQGASTITMQFVKNALEAQGSRTVLQKFREAALAYRVEQNWSKDKILTEYLNTIYFGEGAYGIEAAARTYFGDAHPTCGTRSVPCASVLLPHEAAMLAGIISSPSAYDPKLHPLAAKQRRDLVLERMFEQGYVTEDEYRDGAQTAIPSATDVAPPEIDSEAPYFTTWLRQQLVDKYGAGKAFFGGLKVQTTLDLSLQEAADAAVYNRTAALGGITSSVVVIDNETGSVKAMVGGSGYEDQPFNIAAYGARQPGSAFKPFTLVSALELGHSPSEVFSSAPKEFHFGKRGRQVFEVENYEDNYSGSADLYTATTLSDNSVYADLGVNLKKKPQQSTAYIARTAHRMGIDSPLSLNPAMILGGLKRGVSPLEMAQAYSTLAEGGLRISGTLSPRPGKDPISFTRVTDAEGKTIDENDSIKERVLPKPVADTAREMLVSVVSAGTGQLASGVSDYQWGKTGTTENNGDAWFCGATEAATACVWVGHADSVTPMETEYGGQPVDGGTIPALIWHDVMASWEEILATRAVESGDERESDDTYVPSPSTDPTYPAPAPSDDGSSGGSGATAPSTEAPAPQSAPAPPAPSGGAATGGGGISPG